MKCSEIENNIIFVIEGSFTKSKSADFQNHIDSCENCRNLYHKMQKEFQFIQNDKISKINPFFYDSLIKKIEDNKTDNNSIISIKTRQLLVQSLAYAAGIVLAIFIGIGLGVDFNLNNDLVIDNLDEPTEYQMFADSYNLNQPSELTFELEISENK